MECEDEIQILADVNYLNAGFELVRYSLPSIVTSMIHRSTFILNFLVLGRLGDSAFISGVGLGIMTYTIACVSISKGLGGAIDTL